MDKWQALHNFWNGFNIPAYDEQTAFTEGTEESYPHITYESAGGVMGQISVLTASLWYRSPSWEDISQKADEISQYIYNHSAPIPIDNGYLWIKMPEGVQFAQRADSGSGDENIKRIVLNVEAECLTAY